MDAGAGLLFCFSAVWGRSGRPGASATRTDAISVGFSSYFTNAGSCRRQSAGFSRERSEIRRGSGGGLGSGSFQAPPAFLSTPTPRVALFRYTFSGPSFLQLLGDLLLKVTDFFGFLSHFGHQLGSVWVVFSMLFACFCLAPNLDRFWGDLLSTFRCPEPRFLLENK